MARLIQGTKVVYTGDCANHAGKGSIAKVTHGRFGTSLLVVLAAEGTDKNPEYNIPEREFWITPNAFIPGPGCHFKIEESS